MKRTLQILIPHIILLGYVANNFNADKVNNIMCLDKRRLIEKSSTKCWLACMKTMVMNNQLMCSGNVWCTIVECADKIDYSHTHHKKYLFHRRCRDTYLRHCHTRKLYKTRTVGNFAAMHFHRLHSWQTWEDQIEWSDCMHCRQLVMRRH